MPSPSRLCKTILLCCLLLAYGCREKSAPPVPLDPAGVEIRVGVLSAERILVRMPGRVEIRPLAGGEPLYRGELPGTVAAVSAGTGIELAGMAFAAAVRVVPLGDRSGEAGGDFAPGAGPRPQRLPALYHRAGADFTVTAILDGAEASSYRGALELSADDGLVQAVNALDLQSYLLGVVGAEMPAYFEAEALAAQAIVSRTFALYNIERARSNAQPGVFRATTGFQVYKGFSAEARSTRKAVVETRGQVLSWRGALFSSYFHSTCGGRTANANEALGVTAIEPLAGVACGGCAAGSFYRWDSRLGSSELEDVARRYLRKNSPEVALGAIEELEVIERAADGRALYLRLRHSLGSFEWRADSFRLAVEARFPSTVRSTAFTPRKDASGEWVLSGSGFGHGVGLCQVGARGMAREGTGCREILQHYYPGSEWMKAY